MHTLTSCHGQNVKQMTLQELKNDPNYSQEVLADTVLRGAVVDRCCGCAIPDKKNPICQDADKPKKNNHWHCIREKNTFIHVECGDSDCDICELRQRANTYDGIDSRYEGGRSLLDLDDDIEMKYQSLEEPAGMSTPMPMLISTPTRVKYQ